MASRLSLRDSAAALLQGLLRVIQMRKRSTSVVRAGVVFAAVGLLLAACSGSDDAVEMTAGDGTSTETASGPSIAGSVSDDDLLVPRDYLQGDWCDSDGSSWTVDGDTARREDTSGGVAQLPVDLAFINDLDSSLVSQTDSEFEVAVRGKEVTFTRGSC